MCLCIMPWLAFTANWGTSSRNHTFHKGYICGWLYSWYCDLQHADRSVQQESHDSRSIGTSPKNAWCWLHTRCNHFWFLDLGYGHSHTWEAAVAILLLDMEKTRCQPTKSTFHVLIDVHQWAGKCKQAEIWCPSDRSAGFEPSPATLCMLMGSFGNGGEPEQLRQCLTRAWEILMVTATSCTLHHGLMQSCEIKIMCMGKNMKSEGMEL
jgi:hypothetical protein